MSTTVVAGGRMGLDVVTSFLRDECPLMAAAISYYTIFALPPLLALLARLAGKALAPAELQTLLFDQVTTFAGARSAGQVIDVVQHVSQLSLSGPAAIVGLVAVTLGATSAFVQLQRAMNRTWGVAPDPRRSEVRTFLVSRAVSLLMIVVVGGFILFLVTVTTLLSVFHDAIRHYAPSALAGGVLPVTDAAASFLVMAAVFTGMLRYVPDAVIRWRDALVGGAFTSVLFTPGKLAIGYYLSRTDLANVYGAAASLVVALLWVYYSAAILLMGAEFTRVWACRAGKPVEPERGAVRVEWWVRPMDDAHGSHDSVQPIGAS